MSRKEVKLNQLRQIIFERGGIPKTVELAELLDVSERTVCRYVEEVTADIAEVALDDIKQALLLRIRKRVPEFKDGDLIRLLAHFVPKKMETSTQVEATIKVVGWGLDIPKRNQT